MTEWLNWTDWRKKRTEETTQRKISFLSPKQPRGREWENLFRNTAAGSQKSRAKPLLCFQPRELPIHPPSLKLHITSNPSFIPNSREPPTGPTPPTPCLWSPLFQLFLAASGLASASPSSAWSSQRSHPLHTHHPLQRGPFQTGLLSSYSLL